MIHIIETKEEVFCLPKPPTLYKGNYKLGSPVYVPNAFELPIKSLNTHPKEDYDDIVTVFILSKFAKEVIIPESKVELIVECNKDEDGNDCVDGVPIFPTIEHFYDWLCDTRPALVVNWMDEEMYKPMFFLSKFFRIFHPYDQKYYEEYVEPILNHKYGYTSEDE